MKIYDSAHKEKLDFIPANEPNTVNIYVCGPTVYDDAHLGHARSSISFDLLRRVLCELGFSVKFARNYTDIDDKILHKMSTTGKSLEQITEHYIASFESDMKAMNVLEPDFKPKATESIADIIAYIKKLEANGAAYIVEGDGVYFDTSLDDEYLSLSGRKVENLQARVEREAHKKNEKDFALWKFDENYYDAPFGKGRPGWHSECVAMIYKIFTPKEGQKYQIDIHCGGSDLIFPHHDNESAQFRCACKQNLAKYWMHNGFVQINNEKMSKSLGNSFFIKDALKIAPGEALRFYLLSTHYRANFNYSIDDLSASKKRLDKIYRLKKRLSGVAASEVNANFKQGILDFLSDDLNISGALATLDEMVNDANAALDSSPKDKALKAQTMANLEFARRVFGILENDENEWFQWGVSDTLKERISSLIAARQTAKKDKNFELADSIRSQLGELGVELMDTPAGTVWEKI